MKIEMNSAKLLAKVAGIFKLFYDSDVLEEEAIMEWSKKVSRKYVSKEIATEIHEKAKPFIQWLKEADEEESSEEEADDFDLEIEYNDHARVEPLKAAVVVTPVDKKLAADDDEGDDIDIDDI